MCKYGNVCPHYNDSAENCKKDEGYEDLDCISTLFIEYKKVKQLLDTMSEIQQKQAKTATYNHGYDSIPKYIGGPLKVCNSCCYNQPPYRGSTNVCPPV